MRPAAPPGPYLVVGLARSGVAALRTLRASGETATGVDAGAPPGLEDEPGVVLGTDGLAQLDALRVAAVVKSPGVPRQAPVVAEALRRGLPVLGELELGWRLMGANPFIAVTGTNGKTTTTELLGAIHREAGVAHAVAGNVGTAVTALRLPAGAVVIAEASSFQLEDTLAFAPDAAVLLNLGADHLDRHGSEAAYHEAKRQAFARQGPEAIAVSTLPVPGDARRVAPLRIGDDGAVHDEHGAMPVRLRGPHNLENAAAAAAVALARGIPRAAVAAALGGFAGVVHRLEEIAERDGVLYVNDSKATNVGAALVGLRAFAGRRVHVILGGSGKGEDFSPLAGAVLGPAYLIGEEAERIAAVLPGEVHRSGTLEAALAQARAAAAPGDVVLLSPACASYDQFANFEARGDRFRELVTG